MGHRGGLVSQYGHRVPCEYGHALLRQFWRHEQSGAPFAACRVATSRNWSRGPVWPSSTPASCSVISWCWSTVRPTTTSPLRVTVRRRMARLCGALSSRFSPLRWSCCSWFESYAFFERFELAARLTSVVKARITSLAVFAAFSSILLGFLPGCSLLVSSPCRVGCSKKFDDCASKCEMDPRTQKDCRERCDDAEASCTNACG